MACGFESRSWYMVDYNALSIYTDGSFDPKSRNGGVGISFVFPEYLNIEPKAVCPYGYQKATNNQMELKACCIALQESLKFEKQWNRIIIYTDSSYVVDNYARVFYWRSNGWRNRDGCPVCNAELWKELLKRITDVMVSVDFKWVKGHKKNKNNNLADKLADDSAKKAVNKPLKVVTVRRKISSKSNEVGSVTVSGQKICIRIIETEYLKLQKIYRCKYEVMSKSNSFFRCVDIIHSDEALRAGHEYFVKLNSNNKFPKVEKIYKDKTREKRKNDN